MASMIITPQHVITRLGELAREAGYQGRDLDQLLGRVRTTGTVRQTLEHARELAQNLGYASQAAPILEQVEREIGATVATSNGHAPQTSTTDNEELLKRVFAKAREIATRKGYCDTAEDIIGEIEDAFAMETHPAYKLAKAFGTKVEQEEEWAEDADTSVLVAHGFRAGWDAAREAL